MSPRDQTSQARSLSVVPRSEPRVGFDDYDRIEPGIYRAYCREARIYRDPFYKRWVCLLRWDVLDNSSQHTIARVPQWFSLGSAEKPHAGRRSKYFAEWIRANGAPPSRRDRLPCSVFRRRAAKIEVRDTNGVFPYSVVNAILDYETG